MLKNIVISSCIIYSFLASAADMQSPESRILAIIKRAEAATSPDELISINTNDVQILYHLDTFEKLLKFSWYLVSRNEEELAIVQDYLIASHPDRSPRQFDLHPMPNGKKALMIFFEMVTQKNLLWRVTHLRNEIDHETEGDFWLSSDKNAPYISLQAYSTLHPSEHTKPLYQDTLTQCKPIKYFKVQLFAIAKNYPQFDISFNGSSRVIRYKGHQIWPVASSGYLDYNDFLHDLNLKSQKMSFLDGYNTGLFRMVPGSDEQANKYNAVHAYIGSGELTKMFQSTYSYIEAPFWQVVRLCAVRNATEAARARYLKPQEPLNLVSIANITHPAVHMLLATIATNKDAQKLLTGILYSENIRDHLFAEAKRGGKAWHDWTNYPFTDEDMRIDDEDTITQSPLTSLLSFMRSNYELLKDAMSEDLSAINTHFYTIWGSELSIGTGQMTKALEYSLAMALMAYSDQKLQQSLLDDQKLADLLALVPEEQVASVSRLTATMNTFYQDMVFIAQRRNKSLEQENLHRQAENVQIDAHNKEIDAECAAITARVEQVLADLPQ